MIESLTIQDFQAHKKLKIKLDPHITTIVGDSDTGKSSVLRALKLLATNKPSGSSFVRHGAKQTKITAIVDGQKIQRVRASKGSKNLYRLNGKTLKAFGGDVPETIQKIFNVSEINFQQQYDAPFWFSETSGEVSRRLNKIINLSAIDIVLNSLQTKIRKETAKLEICDERLATARTDKKSLKVFKIIAADLDRIEQQEKQIQKLEDVHEKTKALVKEFVMSEKLATIAPLDLGPLQEMQDEIYAITSKANILNQAIADTEEQERLIGSSAKELTITEKEFKTKLGKRCPLCQSKIKKQK